MSSKDTPSELCDVSQEPQREICSDSGCDPLLSGGICQKQLLFNCTSYIFSPPCILPIRSSLIMYLSYSLSATKPTVPSLVRLQTSPQRCTSPLVTLRARGGPEALNSQRHTAHSYSFAVRGHVASRAGAGSPATQGL